MKLSILCAIGLLIVILWQLLKNKTIDYISLSILLIWTAVNYNKIKNSMKKK